MRSERLLSCLLLLQGTRRRTARDLAAALEVSMRTVYRDVEALGAAGVPIHMERGPQGGIVLADDYRRAIAQFTDDELQALFAGSTGPMADLGLASARGALQKLAGALPAAQRRAAERGRDRLLVDHNRWFRGEQPRDALVALRRAVAEDCRVRIRYRDREGTLTDRIVDPLGLVAKAGVWYLVSREGDKGYRTFRAERIAGVATTGERFTRPADFDLDAHWRSSMASVRERSGPAYEATLRVRADVLGWLTSSFEAETLAADADGTLLRVRFPARDVAASHIVMMGDTVTIVGPSDLPDEVVRCARAAIERHGANATA